MLTKKELAKTIEKGLADRGLLIEAGFAGFRIMAIPNDASAAQIDDQRMCFFAGAQHLFGSIMGTMDPGTDATEADMRRMENISKELDQFIVAFKKKLNVPSDD